jgi:hypothetical protein
VISTPTSNPPPEATIDSLRFHDVGTFPAASTELATAKLQDAETADPTTRAPTHM